MKVIGIDPGLSKTGIGVISKNGSFNIGRWEIVSPKKNLDLPEKIHFLFHSMLDIIDREKPEAIAIEKLFFGQNTKTLIHLGELRGVFLLASVEKKIPVYEYTPREVKMAITGSGASSKDQVEYMVKQILNINEKIPSDASDAIAIGLCYLLREKND